MSLPSKAIFRDENGCVLKTSFINCGWFFELNVIPRLLMDLKESDGYPDMKWHSVEMYGVTLAYDEASNVYNIEKFRRSIRDAKQFVSDFHEISDYQLEQLYSEVISLGNKLNEIAISRKNKQC